MRVICSIPRRPVFWAVSGRVGGHKSGNSDGDLPIAALVFSERPRVCLQHFGHLLLRQAEV